MDRNRNLYADNEPGPFALLNWKLLLLLFGLLILVCFPAIGVGIANVISSVASSFIGAVVPTH